MLKKIVKRTIDIPLSLFDLSVINKKKESFKSNLNSNSFPKRLGNMKTAGFSPRVIFDGGANTGNWTKAVSRLFPEAEYILIEPVPDVSEKIKINLKDLKINYRIIKKALGSSKGEVDLNIWDNSGPDLQSSSVCGHISGEPTRKIKAEMTSLDLISEDTGLNPDLIKIDLQGYELEALNGSKKLLQNTELFIIEFGCLEAYLNRTSVRCLIDLMYDNDYTLYDIVDLNYRPYDNALTGGDFFFIKNSSKLRSYKGWK